MVKKEVFIFDAASSFHLIYLEANHIPLNIHYHTEYELTLTINSSGFRHIAESVTEYHSPDLVLIAPGQAHSWRSVDQSDECYRYVILFPSEWGNPQATHDLKEFSSIGSLFLKAIPGVIFSSQCAERCIPYFQALVGNENPLSRLSNILQVLACLTEDKGSLYIANSGSPAIQNHQRLDKALRYIQANFTQAIELNDIAKFVHCSPSSLKRDFKIQMGVPFSRYLNGLRVQRACHLLVTTELAIPHVAERCGFGSTRQFFRCFSQTLHKTPLEYRKHGRK